MKFALHLMLVIIMLFVTTQSAHAVLTIEITKGVEGALPIAIVPFEWDGPQVMAPENIAAIVSNDLHRSGQFNPLPVKDMLSKPHEGIQINFRDWRILGIENLVIGKLYATETGYLVQFQLYDVFRQTLLMGYSLRSDRQEIRRTGHRISDMIYETILGERGAFATRIAYVTETLQPDNQRRYSLQISDADGYNANSILNSSFPIMSPSWSPDGSKVAYVSFETGFSSIYIQDVESGKRELISHYKGINGAPAWSSDGRKLAVVLSKDGNPDIYVLNLANKKLKRITRNYAIDTEPVWSPDGGELIFTSDRGGKPQLYQANLRTKNGEIQRLTFEGEYNARATISPDGRYIAMVHGDSGKYRIAVMELATGAIHVITDSVLDESPSFAPNGSMIIYATKDGSRGLLSAVSVDGRVKQRLVLQEGHAREPSWSPFIQ